MGNEIKVTMMKLAELVPYENNPRDNSKAVKAFRLADNKTAEKAAVERWELSEREMAIVKSLG